MLGTLELRPKSMHVLCLLPLSGVCEERLQGGFSQFSRYWLWDQTKHVEFHVPTVQGLGHPGPASNGEKPTSRNLEPGTPIPEPLALAVAILDIGIRQAREYGY